jgi:hypothetical protein
MDNNKAIAYIEIPNSQDPSGAHVVRDELQSYLRSMGILDCVHLSIESGGIYVYAPSKLEKALKEFEERNKGKRLHVKLHYPIEAKHESATAVRNQEPTERNRELVQRLSEVGQREVEYKTRIAELEKLVANITRVRIEGLKEDTTLEALGRTLSLNDRAYVDAQERTIAPMFYAFSEKIPDYQLAEGLLQDVEKAEKAIMERGNYFRKHGLKAVSDIPDSELREKLFSQWDAAEQTIKAFKEMSFVMPIRIAEESGEEADTYTVIIPINPKAEDENSIKLLDTLKKFGDIFETKFGVACDYLGDKSFARLQIRGDNPKNSIEYELGQAFGRVVENATIKVIYTPFLGEIPERK